MQLGHGYGESAPVGGLAYHFGPLTVLDCGVVFGALTRQFDELRYRPDTGVVNDPVPDDLRPGNPVTGSMPLPGRVSHSAIRARVRRNASSSRRSRFGSASARHAWASSSHSRSSVGAGASSAFKRPI